MKALTLTQPWASAVAIGLKRWETRSWRTNYRGPLAIHAAKGFPGWARDFAKAERVRLPRDLPLGAVVAVADLIGCHPTRMIAPTVSETERHFGDYTPGRWAWMLDNVRALPEPLPWRGAQGLWDIDLPDLD